MLLTMLCRNISTTNHIYFSRNFFLLIFYLFFKYSISFKTILLLAISLLFLLIERMARNNLNPSDVDNGRLNVFSAVKSHHCWQMKYLFLVLSKLLLNELEPVFYFTCQVLDSHMNSINKNHCNFRLSWKGKLQSNQIFLNHWIFGCYLDSFLKPKAMEDSLKIVHHDFFVFNNFQS